MLSVAIFSANLQIGLEREFSRWLGEQLFGEHRMHPVRVQKNGVHGPQPPRGNTMPQRYITRNQPLGSITLAEVTQGPRPSQNPNRESFRTRCAATEDRLRRWGGRGPGLLLLPS